MRMIRLTIALIIVLVLMSVVSAFGLGVTGKVGSATLTTTTGQGYIWTANSLTSGTLLRLVCDDDALNGGLYLDCYGGASHNTSIWSIGEGGLTTIGGGYSGGSGATITAAGAGSFNAALKTDTTLYAGTTTTLVGNARADGTLRVGGVLTAAAALSVGTTTTLTGNTTVGGTFNSDGAATVASLTCTAAGTFGGGYAGGSGATISTAGVGQFNGALTTDTTLSVGTTSTLTGNVSMGGTLVVTGAATLPVAISAGVTESALVCTSAHYGKTLFVSSAAACAITLPANGAAAGSWIRFICNGTDSTVMTIAAATADTLITFNDAAADSVTFGAGHRIGACVKVISDGTYWIAINESSNTMTVATN